MTGIKTCVTLEEWVYSLIVSDDGSMYMHPGQLLGSTAYIHLRWLARLQI